MIPLTPQQAATLADWFLPERPGPLVAAHFIHTGFSSCYADRWPDPRAVLVEAAGNYTLTGDPSALSPAVLSGRVKGFLEAPDDFLPLLQETFPDMQEWPRVMYWLKDAPRLVEPPAGYTIRPLTPADAPQLHQLSPESSWISITWGGPEGLASSGHAWGAFTADGRLVSVACNFFLGFELYEIGVITEPGYRGQRLSAACVGRLCQDIQRASRIPSWTTSPDNIGSWRVAEKVGFTFCRQDRLWVIGMPIPIPPTPQDEFKVSHPQPIS